MSAGPASPTLELGRTRSSTAAPTRRDPGPRFVAYYLHGWGLKAGILLDAVRPGGVLAALAGARPVAGHADTVDAPAGQLSARRIGNAWLVVKGGSELVQRLLALGALRIGKLDLGHIRSH